MTLQKGRGYVWGIALFSAVAVTLFYAFKPAGKDGGFFPWDKADHFSCFFVLTILSILAFPRQPLWRIGVGLSVLGILIEIVQALPMVGRDGDVWDWAAEMCALAAVYGTIMAARIRRSVEAGSGNGN